MGYTRYWSCTGKKFTQEFADLNRAVVSIADKEYGIIIRNGLGEGEPTIDTEQIWLNGDGTKGLDHETYYLKSGDDSSFDFCKTAQKPYDLVVNALLRIAEEYGYVKNVTNDGSYLDADAENLVAKAKTLVQKNKQK
jgi:hypothetical protein